MKTDTSTETNEELVEAIERAGLTPFKEYLVERREREERELREREGDYISSKPSVDLLLRYVINGLYTCAHDVLNRFEYPREMNSHLVHVRQASLSRITV